MNDLNEVYARRRAAGVKVLRVSVLFLVIWALCWLGADGVTVRRVGPFLPAALRVGALLALLVVCWLLVANRGRLRSLPFRFAVPRGKYRKYDNYRRRP